MATSSCFPVTWFDTRSDAFYFQVVNPETDVVEDSFEKSKCLGRWVRSEYNKFLLLNDEKKFQVQNLTSEQLSQPACKFQIQIYSDMERVAGEEGKFVMLYVKHEGKNMVVCCRQGPEVYPEEMDTLPNNIEERKHKALFFMTKLTACNTFTFKSSVYPSSFLGFQPDGDNPSLNKLVLLKKERMTTEEVDNSMKVILLK